MGLKNHYNNLQYLFFIILSLFSISLIFNNNVWFDEAYTLSLIQHTYSDVIEILKSDMHPPLYFVSLKFFCEIFGYSITATKIFSMLGYIATLFLGCTIVKKHYGPVTSIIYMLTVGAVPMSLYFSVQQRSYEWCIFFVTLCFTEAMLFIENNKFRHCVLFVIAALLAAYNHIYALLAVGIIFALVNIYIFIKSRRLLKAIIISDISMVVGYSLWIIPLLNQTKSASESFWLKSVEPLSVIVFISGIVISALILIKKVNRKLPIVFAIISILSVQFIGLLVTIFIRPFYIARYSVVILGVFALLIAFVTKNIKLKIKKTICVLLCILNIICVVATGMFEYNSSMTDFFNSFEAIGSSSDIFVYCDSSFGIMSYYFPENRHICTYSESWFAAFDNVECIDKKELSDEFHPDDTVWFVKNKLTKLPEYIESNFNCELVDSFKCDFNSFEVYSIKLKLQ
ncbi:MAG: glycosyltransferase family 39 protein [Firmicutes bacterium]|nr:glycosyltransferase family 39 protein [Bacillota bacterium]